MDRVMAVVVALASFAAADAGGCCITVSPFRSTAADVIVLEASATENGLLTVTRTLKGSIAGGHGIRVLPSTSTANCNTLDKVLTPHSYVLVISSELMRDSTAARLSSIPINMMKVAEGDEADLIRREAASLHPVTRRDVIAAFKIWARAAGREESSRYLMSADLDRAHLGRLAASVAPAEPSSLASSLIHGESGLLEILVGLVNDLETESPRTFVSAIDNRLAAICRLLEQLPAEQQIAAEYLTDATEVEDTYGSLLDEIERQIDALWKEIDERGVSGSMASK